MRLGLAELPNGSESLPRSHGNWVAWRVNRRANQTAHFALLPGLLALLEGTPKKFGRGSLATRGLHCAKPSPTRECVHRTAACGTRRVGGAIQYLVRWFVQWLCQMQRLSPTHSKASHRALLTLPQIPEHSPWNHTWTSAFLGTGSSTIRLHLGLGQMQDQRAVRTKPMEQGMKGGEIDA